MSFWKAVSRAFITLNFNTMKYISSRLYVIEQRLTVRETDTFMALQWQTSSGIASVPHILRRNRAKNGTFS
jgi:hypothetical protein